MFWLHDRLALTRVLRKRQRVAVSRGALKPQDLEPCLNFISHQLFILSHRRTDLEKRLQRAENCNRGREVSADRAPFLSRNENKGLSPSALLCLLLRTP